MDYKKMCISFKELMATDCCLDMDADHYSDLMLIAAA